MQRAELVSQFIGTSQTVQRAWKAQYHRIMAEERLSPAQMGILFLLKQRQPVSASDIAKELHISRSAVTQIIDVLTKQGYVLREVDKNDKRVSYLCLSQQGNAKVGQLEAQRHKVFESVAESLTNEELQILSSIHAKILKALEK